MRGRLGERPGERLRQRGCEIELCKTENYKMKLCKTELSKIALCRTELCKTELCKRREGGSRGEEKEERDGHQ